MVACLERKRKEGRTKYKEVMQPVQGHAATVDNCPNFVFSSICAGFSLSFGMCRGHEFVGVLPTFSIRTQQSN